MFQITENEVDSMVSQSAIPSRQHLGASLKDLGKQCFAFSRTDGLLSNILGKWVNRAKLATQPQVASL